MKRLTLVILACAALAPASAHADIPAFARKYGLPCASCHDPVPRLTPFGEAFARNGFRLAEGDTTGTTSLGDPLLRIQEVLPVAIRFDAYVRARRGTTVNTDFQTPTVVKLLSGGPVADGVTYYFYLLLAEDGHTGPIEDAWVMFSRPLGLPADLTVGQFQIADPVWKRELRITLENYEILRHRVGSGAANLTYDRGLLVATKPFGPLEVSAMMVNGNGIGDAVGGTWDGDAPKTGAVWLTGQAGPARLSLLGYYGRQRLVPAGLTASRSNRTRMIGPAVTLSRGPLDFGGQVIWRDDTNPDFVALPATVKTTGGFLEGMWWPQGRGGRSLVTTLYNVIDSDASGGDYESLTLNGSWLYRRNVRLALEGTWDFRLDQPRVAIGVVTAF